jgi:hypothetical protein
MSGTQIPYLIIYSMICNLALQLLVMELPLGLFVLFTLEEFWRRPSALKLVHLTR